LGVYSCKVFFDLVGMIFDARDTYKVKKDLAGKLIEIKNC
jgi:hypothetical protein